MAGEEEREHLVTELRVAHRLAAGLLGIRRDEQQREQVAARMRVGGGAALGDHGIDDAVESVARRVEAAHDGEWETERPARDGKEHERRGAHRIGERAGHLARAVADVGPEERLAGDAQRERRHLGREVDDGARRAPNEVGPAVAPPHGVVAHGGGVCGDTFAVEGGLRDAPLAAVELPFAGEQAVAEEELEAAVGVAAGESLLLGDEHLAGELRVRDEDERAAGGAEADDVAVAGEAAEERERLAGDGDGELAGPAGPDGARHGHGGNVRVRMSISRWADRRWTGTKMRRAGAAQAAETAAAWVPYGRARISCKYLLACTDRPV